jgi:hypothetical protein
MRADRKTIEELKRLLMEYEIEIEQRMKEDKLKYNTVRTYLYHPKRFVKWCKGESIFSDM